MTHQQLQAHAHCWLLPKNRRIRIHCLGHCIMPHQCYRMYYSCINCDPQTTKAELFLTLMTQQNISTIVVFLVRASFKWPKYSPNAPTPWICHYLYDIEKRIVTWIQNGGGDHLEFRTTVASSIQFNQFSPSLVELLRLHFTWIHICNSGKCLRTEIPVGGKP